MTKKSLLVGYVISWSIWYYLLQQRDQGATNKFEFLSVLLTTEILKLIFCIIFALYQTRSETSHPFRKFYYSITLQKHIGIFCAIPGFIYLLSSLVLYYHLLYFNTNLYKIILNFGVILAGWIYQIFSKKSLPPQTWISLFLLSLAGGSIYSISTNGLEFITFGYFISVVLLSVICNFSSIFYEYILKHERKGSIMIFNIYLYAFSIITILGFLLLVKRNMFTYQHFFEGYSHVTWLLIASGGVGGVLSTYVLRSFNTLFKLFLDFFCTILVSILISGGDIFSVDALFTFFLGAIAFAVFMSKASLLQSQYLRFSNSIII